MKQLKVVLPFLILIGIYWILFVPGPRAAGDFPYTYISSVRAGLNIPLTWSSRGMGMGEYGVSTLWAWPVDLLYGLGSTAGINFSALERILGIIPILLLGVFGIKKLLAYFKIEGWGSWLGTIFYLTNTYIVLVIDGGQFAIGLAYAWLPAAFLAFENGIFGDTRRKVLAAFAVSLLGFFDIRFVYVLALLLSVRFITELLFINPKYWASWVLSWFKVGFVVCVVMVGLNSYWLFPSILAKVPSLPATYARGSQASFLSFATLGHSLLLQQPHWFKNIFGNIPAPRAEFILVPLLVFLAPILKRKDKVVVFWLAVALSATFLVKGTNPPLGSVYGWLFSNVPGFSLFRDPTKFFFLTALSYSVLIGITANALLKRIKIKILPVALTFYFIILAWPVYLGKLTGTLSNPPHQTEYSQAAQLFEGDKNFGRILWIPTISPLGYSSPTHPALDASRLTGLTPFASAVKGTYETFNFLRAPYIQHLLDIAGVKYIVYPYPDVRREMLKPDNIDYYHWFLAEIADSPWAKIREDWGGMDSPVPVIEVDKHEDRFFLSPGVWWIIGSDRIYEDLAKIPDFDLAQNALVFAEEHPGLSQRLKEFPNALLLVYGKNEIDFAANFMNENHLIFPAKNLGFSPDKTGWWKREAADLISWRGFLQEKYAIDNKDFDLGGGWAVGEGGVKLQIVNDKFKKERILLSRVMESARGGKIEFYQGNDLVGAVSTKTESTGNDTNVRWFEVGSLKSEAPVEMKTYGDINVVNALASVSEQEWGLINQSIRQYEKVEWNKLTDKEKKFLFNNTGAPIVAYRRINAAHYEVEVQGMHDSAILAFSETYDPLWQINRNGDPIPIYGLINGFKIDQDGIYDIYFTPQKYVVPGLAISVLVFVSLGAFLVISKKRKRKI